MDARIRAESIVEIARRGDEALLKSFAYDMILNAKSEAREQCAKIAESDLCVCKQDDIHEGCCAACGSRIATAIRKAGESL